ncbi:MAG: hypothetical protein JOZ07_06905 [Solirubrobacterales bacterium]|nr:hypothetical protein [Solirubrobacterales bacterium]
MCQLPGAATGDRDPTTGQADSTFDGQLIVIDADREGDGPDQHGGLAAGSSQTDSLAPAATHLRHGVMSAHNPSTAPRAALATLHGGDWRWVKLLAVAVPKPRHVDEPGVARVLREALREPRVREPVVVLVRLTVDDHHPVCGSGRSSESPNRSAAGGELQGGALDAGVLERLVVLGAAALGLGTFDTGRLPAGRWRLTVYAYGALVVALVAWTAAIDVGAFVDRVPRIDSTGELRTAGDSAALIAPYFALSLS